MTIYCTAPFTGLTVRENGQVRTCCVGKTSLGDLNTQSIAEIEKSDVLRYIQRDMIADSPNLENCQACLYQERISGLAPLRQMYQRQYPVRQIDSLDLRFVDVRWNNTCNLGCLYCNKDFSTVWEKRLGQSRSIVKKSYQDDLLAWILERTDHVEEVMLVGGEPMLMKQNYVLLNRLPLSSRVSIITNLSYDLANLPCILDLLKRPTDQIVWNVSLENTGDKFEYVRSGALWDQIMKNFAFLKYHWPNSVSLNMVYSVFSAFDLKETVDFFLEMELKKINLCPVSGNNSMNVNTLPRVIRQAAADILKSTEVNLRSTVYLDDSAFYGIQGLDEIYQALLDESQHESTTLDEFDKKIQWYDQWGSKKFHELWPDIYQTIRSALIEAQG